MAVWAVGGAVSRIDPEATAVGERDFGLRGQHRGRLAAVDPDGERHVAWVREGWEALRPYAAGSTPTSSPTRVPRARAAYGERLQRLTALKDRYDPENVFRLNANIPPSRWP